MSVATLTDWLRRHACEAGLWVGVMVCCMCFVQIVELDNSVSRYLSVAAVVNHGTLALDAYPDPGIDISGHGGHVYSNKAPGALVVGVPAYWLLRRCTGLGAGRELALGLRYGVRVAGSSLPHAVTAVLVMLVALQLGAGRRWAVFGALAYGVGSIGWQQAIQFGGHTLTAMWGMLALYGLLRVGRGEGGGRLALAAGLAAGMCVVTEYTAALLVVAMALYLGLARPRMLGWYGLGGALVAVGLGWYCWHCFGSPFALSYGALADPRFAAETKEGVMGFGMPRLATTWALVGGPARGMLAISPVLALAVAGFWRLIRAPSTRHEGVLLASGCVVYVVVLSGYFGWHSGWSYGCRYLVAIAPWLGVGVALCGGRVGWLEWLALGVSIVCVGCSVAGLPYVPPMFRNPLVDVILPCTAAGCWALNPATWLGLPAWMFVVVLVVAMAGWIAWLWRVAGAPPEAGEVVPHWGRWRVALGLLLAVVALQLAFVHEPERGALARFQAVMLYDRVHPPKGLEQ